MKSRYIAFFLLLLVTVSCEPKLDEFTPSAGSADFTKYISLGNSLTAGYSDYALYTSGQSYSYPNLIARQMKLAGGGEFIQPEVTNEDGLLAGKLKLGFSTNCLGVTSLGPVQAGGTPTGYPDAALPIGYTVNNFGVPGAKSFHLIAPGYGDKDGLLDTPPTANTYFVRFASSAATTVLADAVAASPTFFSLWIGNNDVLGYSTSGGMDDAITDQATFSYSINTIITNMTANGAKGIVANIPDVTSIPFFTTVPFNGLVLTRQGQVDSLNYGYHSIGATHINFTLGLNAFVIEDPTVPGYGMRQINSNEYVLLSLPQDLIRCEGYGSQVPIPGGFTLVESEVNAIKTATAGYNQTLKNLAEASDLAFVDVNSFLANAKTGLIYDGIKFSLSYVTGGVFSLDGVHLTPRGNAIVANKFIDAINLKYNSTIPHVNVGDYPGLLFPEIP
ncbi:MAG: SGNH/GDSL hydrolase family protein [Bacteroidota bacterium]